LKEAVARRRLAGSADETDTVETETVTNTTLTAEEFEKMAAEEQFVLTITEKGYGKRSSAYEYRITSRGTQGVTNIKTDDDKRKANVVASMPVPHASHIMLVTDAGKLIRMRTDDIRIAGRSTMGVILFRLGKNEKVVSATCITDIGEDETEEENTQIEETIQPEESIPTKMIEKEM
jgi:DNA gyrase subunit A